MNRNLSSPLHAGRWSDRMQGRPQTNKLRRVPLFRLKTAAEAAQVWPQNGSPLRPRVNHFYLRKTPKSPRRHYRRCRAAVSNNGAEAGLRSYQLLFLDRKVLCCPDAHQARSSRYRVRRLVLREGVCNSVFRCGAPPFRTTLPADGKIATPVPRDSCTSFCEAPILTKIRGPASNRARGVVFRRGDSLASKTLKLGINRAWMK